VAAKRLAMRVERSFLLMMASNPIA